MSMNHPDWGSWYMMAFHLRQGLYYSTFEKRPTRVEHPTFCAGSCGSFTSRPARQVGRSRSSLQTAPKFGGRLDSNEFGSPAGLYIDYLFFNNISSNLYYFSVNFSTHRTIQYIYKLAPAAHSCKWFFASSRRDVLRMDRCK